MSAKVTLESLQGKAEVDIQKTIRTVFPSADKKSRLKVMKDSSIITVDKNCNSLKNGAVDKDGIQMIMDAKCFGGRQRVFQHYSLETSCTMKFSAFLPEKREEEERFHVVFFLSGIMCNEQNFLFKTGFQRFANEQRLIVVGVDTSPRGTNFPGEKDAPIFGRSAGWYLDATEEPWKTNYRMYSYISKELPEIILNNFPTTGKFGIVGHSMGGNGTIVIGLRNPDKFRCLSVLAPSCNPISWGQELIYKKFLGDNEELWKTYDACHVIREYKGPQRHILLDAAGDDPYLEFLLPTRLKEMADNNPYECVSVELNLREGYEHSYLFAASFIEDHLAYQKKMLDEDAL